MWVFSWGFFFTCCWDKGHFTWVLFPDKPRKTSISVSGSSDNQVKVGGSLTLTCDTDANPAPTTYSWYRSKNQRPDSWWKTTNSRMLSLTIQRADEACYRCSASKLIGRGDESQPVCIQVLCKYFDVSRDFYVNSNTLFICFQLVCEMSASALV